jgi:threonine/homoserine/homoserine lactone efflux protein
VRMVVACSLLLSCGPLAAALTSSSLQLGFARSVALSGNGCGSRSVSLCRQRLELRPHRTRSSAGCRLFGLRAQLNPDLPPPPEKERVEQQEGINWQALNLQFKLFSKMALPYFKEEKSARMLLFIVICFTLLNSWVSVGFSFLSRDFWSALNTKDTEAFYPTLGKYAIALTGGAPIAVLYRFYREKLTLQWRAWMTLRYMSPPSLMLALGI